MGYILCPKGTPDIHKHWALHRLITCQVLKIEVIPKGFHVHHRDCDKVNNAKENLALLTRSDHFWLHSEFGNSPLKGFMQGEISLSQLLKWSKDPVRAKQLLLTSILNQNVESLGIPSRSPIKNITNNE
jgi:hypothetical protein